MSAVQTWPESSSSAPGSDIGARIVPCGVAASADLPSRAEALLQDGGSHRALGRFVRDAVVAEHSTLLAASRSERALGAASQMSKVASTVVAELRVLQYPDGTFVNGDNVQSPPDTAFTVNDLAWSAQVLREASLESGLGDRSTLCSLLPELEALLSRAAPALVTGGVHTPNHRWEISSALARLGRLLNDENCIERAEQWLAEGVDQQADGLFSERSPNYAGNVSIPALHVLARALGREELAVLADRATLAQADLTDGRGFVETICSRRQDQNDLFDGAAMYPLFRVHAARTRDPLTARAAHRTLPRVDADGAFTLLALGMDDPRGLDPLPGPHPEPSPLRPEVSAFSVSGLTIVDHGSTRVVVHGGTDTAQMGRIASGTASNPTALRFGGRALRLDSLRISRDFFSLGPVRFGPPKPASPLAGDADSFPEVMRFVLKERVAGEYFHPLPPTRRRKDGAYSMEFNGRFAAAMGFSSRATDEVELETTACVEIRPGGAVVSMEFDGPAVPVCLALALSGGRFAGTTTDHSGRTIPERLDASAECAYLSDDERLDIRVNGDLGGTAFYAPGEAYTFLSASDEPTGDALYIPVTTSSDLRLDLTLAQ